MTAAVALSTITSCNSPKTEPASEENFKYLIDEFADIKILRYRIPGWDELTLQQKEYVYHLSEAAKWGRDIYWDQNCSWNLQIRKVLENVIENYEGDRDCKDFKNFMVYAKRVFFSNGIHHHYAEDKFFPTCSSDYFYSLMQAVGDGDKQDILRAIYDSDFLKQRKSTETSADLVATSSVNFYENIKRSEADAFYTRLAAKDDPQPVSYGLNSKLVKDDDGIVREQVWKSGGLYGATIDKICAELELAASVAENEVQKEYIALLVDYYRTGDLRLWDEYNIKWLQDSLGTIDFVNGFVEDYNDPLGRKGAWEALVNIKDVEASKRTEILSSNAQWFEDNSPVDPRFKKAQVKGVTAKVISAVALAGDCYPSTPIGINLPNADWIRKEYGSKSVTISNITAAYDLAAQESPKSTLSEFAYDETEVEMAKKYLSITGDIHTDLHECLGHGSGQLLPGTSPNALGEYSSTLEETRADLFGLYYIADPKLVQLGILPDKEAYKAEYSSYIRNGIMVQFTRVELGRPNTESHMQNRKLIAEWCYEHGKDKNIIERKTRDGKTYFVVNDYEALRGLFGELLVEIQRIKSEGDFEAGKALVESYAVNIDPELHKEVRDRYQALGLRPYGGFVNPDIVPVVENDRVVDYKVVYCDDFVQQNIDYSHHYSVL